MSRVCVVSVSFEAGCVPSRQSCSEISSPRNRCSGISAAALDAYITTVPAAQSWLQSCSLRLPHEMSVPGVNGKVVHCKSYHVFFPMCGSIWRGSPRAPAHQNPPNALDLAFWYEDSGTRTSTEYPTLSFVLFRPVASSVPTPRDPLRARALIFFWTFSVDGEVFSLDANNGAHFLHGGDKGFDKVCRLALHVPPFTRWPVFFTCCRTSWLR